MPCIESAIPDIDARIQDAISDEHVEFFRENGFLVMRQVISPEELALIQADMSRLIEEREEGKEDYWFAEGVFTRGDVLRRIEYVMDKSDIMKPLLAHPFILKSVEKVLGPNFIPTWDSMVLKMPGDGAAVPWHRDGCEHLNDESLNKPNFNVDFYLDEADENNCVWVIPGSNRWSSEKATEVIQSDGFKKEGAIPVCMQPGDVIFHDVKVLHGSEQSRSDKVRRTVYYEFRSLEVEDRFGPHRAEYLTYKQQILLDAQERRTQCSYAANETPFHYEPKGKFAVHQRVFPQTYRYAHPDYFIR